MMTRLVKSRPAGGGGATVNPSNVCEVCWDWTPSQLVVGEGRCFSRLLLEGQSPEGRKGKLGVRGAGKGREGGSGDMQ